jgi:4-hydroxy-tetrahydrodipicolinate reductase
MIKIGISGIAGRMGLRILDLAQADKELSVVFGLESKGHPQAGKLTNGIRIVDDSSGVKACDCLIEFTSPQATLEHLKFLLEFKKAVVIGTTGLSLGQQEKLKQASKIIPIVFSPNMSPGVNLLFRLSKTAAKVLNNYRARIEEAHHVHKKDSPSGTAKKIAEIINSQGFNIKDQDIKAIREDEIVGDHRAIFESDADRIEIIHSAKTRDIFAQGALLAAKWIVAKKPGLYSMEDVLDEA